jgi:hypothetical protein
MFTALFFKRENKRDFVTALNEKMLGLDLEPSEDIEVKFDALSPTPFVFCPV